MPTGVCLRAIVNAQNRVAQQKSDFKGKDVKVDAESCDRCWACRTKRKEVVKEEERRT